MINTQKIILSLFLFIYFSNITFCQIGINTEKPTSALDVNGNTRITGPFLVGGDDNTNGSAGSLNQYLVSQGAKSAPVWKNISAEDYVIVGRIVYLSSISKIDNSGGITLKYPDDFTGSESYLNSYTVSQSAAEIGTDKWYVTFPVGKRYWTEFEDMNFTIPAYNKLMRVFITIQVPLQAYWPRVQSSTTTAWISGAYGVFQKSSTTQAKLVGSMQRACYGTGDSNTPETLATLVTAIDVPASTAERTFMILGTGRSESIVPSPGGKPEDNMNQTLLYMGAPLPGAKDISLKRMTMRIDFFEQN